MNLQLPQIHLTPWATGAIWQYPPLSCKRARSYYGDTACHATRASLSKRYKKARSGFANHGSQNRSVDDGSGLHTPSMLCTGECTRELLESADRESPQPKAGLPLRTTAFARDEHQSRLSSTRDQHRHVAARLVLRMDLDAPCLFLMTSVPCGGSEHTPCTSPIGPSLLAPVEPPPLDSSFLVSFDWGSGECGGDC
jgi:hypothetical protein